MKIVFAQGNPGTRYATTRHNIGWQVLDAWAAKLGVSFTEKSKFQAKIAEATISGEKVLLVKPLTFYNETGQSARSLTDFYKLDPSTDLLVVHDDLALGFGTLRTRQKGSDAGNNGLKSLIAHLGPDFHRLRIGIANDQRRVMGDIDFVLGTFSSDETAELNQSIIPKCLELCDSFAREKLSLTSHHLHTD